MTEAGVQMLAEMAEQPYVLASLLIYGRLGA